MAKASKVIDYSKLLENVEQMINLLEFDAMRGSGKTKLNAANIVDLYRLKDRYEAAMGKTSTPAPVVAVEAPVVAKPSPGRPPKKV
jgi:hypothetical protein